MKLTCAEHKVTPPDPWQELGLAVIRQAADDYRSLAKKIETTGSDQERRSMIREMKAISRFFLSSWCCTLSGCDNGEMILEKLDEEVFGCD